MAKKIIAITDIKRDNNYLYVCGTSEDGFLTIIQVDRSARSQGKKDIKNKNKEEKELEVEDIIP